MPLRYKLRTISIESWHGNLIPFTVSSGPYLGWDNTETSDRQKAEQGSCKWKGSILSVFLPFFFVILFGKIRIQKKNLLGSCRRNKSSSKCQRMTLNNPVQIQVCLFQLLWRQPESIKAETHPSRLKAQVRFVLLTHFQTAVIHRDTWGERSCW